MQKRKDHLDDFSPDLINLSLPPILRTKKEMADIVQCSYDTLRRRLRDNRIVTGKHLLDPPIQTIILEIFGYKVTWQVKKK